MTIVTTEPYQLRYQGHIIHCRSWQIKNVHECEPDEVTRFVQEHIKSFLPDEKHTVQFERQRAIIDGKTIERIWNVCITEQEIDNGIKRLCLTLTCEDVNQNFSVRSLHCVVHSFEELKAIEKLKAILAVVNLEYTC